MKTVLDLREAWETQKGVETKRKANTDVEEAKEHPAYSQLMTLATKMGNQKNRDTRAVQVLAGKISNFTATGNRGMMKDMAKAMKSLDASSQAAVIKILNKTDPSLAKAINYKMAGMKEEVELEEATGKFTDKQIKMAYGIINDPRWKSGNMTSIVRRIEGIAKGLSKHPGVEKALKVTNESVELEEAAPKISTGKAKGSISATGLRGKGMKKFDVNVSVKNGKFEFRISDESGKFQTVDIKQAARMLGESVEDLEAFAIEEARKYTPPSAAEIAADKKKDQRGKPRASMSAKSANKKVYGNMMKKHEEVELDEANLSKVPTDKLKKMIKQAEDERVSPAFAMQVRAARAELKKRGESMKEETEIQERSPLQSIKIALGKKFNKNYEKALEWMKKTGKSAADAERMFRGIDARELAKMAEK